MLKVVFFDTSDNIGKELDTITSTAGYSQIIDKSNRFTNNSSSCIDLIFTSNPSIIVDSGIEKYLSSSCYQDVIYGNHISYHISQINFALGCQNTPQFSLKHLQGDFKNVF